MRLPSAVISAEELACAAWPVAVGRKIAARTRAVKLVRERLVVEVEDTSWQRQLHSLARHILANLQRQLGAGAVADLEFRVMPRRREPQRAQTALPPALFDEADAIRDPVMRSIYKASRKKAGA